MSNKLFEQLYENSKLLVKPPSDRTLPLIERGLSQIHIESEQIAERVANKKIDPKVSSEAHYFLAHHGINSQKATQSIETLDTSKTFTPEINYNDTNVEDFLRREQEKIRKRVLEELGKA
ncbi:hypothetical protein J3Q64DRAFT_1777218 [Phycomyces blakesleeanus]|uniref:Uncharacterized protein n=2 Tax=Phycomyces blakesleeanus TaxID=4837 RepID=A0A167N458_PHYB8|nr:hypothetical protein PHYBLDRAFT_144283 [Phycomyces blakesleeanus NRRL 1555(-)]OAD74930.1 hypothetical protein PHYBLDRAFT_144283 [Phycomyces blakesleeanus NRRL 1555(-)]|eukprot:XP_018292970.1 hypothetical protein PHYBLDRAFT_144283 [Phycomyces blakesleeanus NRRL 1555(-)]